MTRSAWPVRVCDDSPLGKSHIREIADIQIGELRKRLYDQEMSLVVSDDALDLIGEAGFDPVYGARPLKRAIQQQLENPLAQAILSGRYSPNDTIHVELEDDRLVFA